MAGIKGQPAPKPKDVESPVPGNAEKSAFDTFEPSTGQTAGKAASAFDTFNPGPDAGAQTPQAQGPGLGAQALDATGRTLDYPGGFVRAGLAEVAGMATGQPNTVTPEDLKAAAVGKGPNSAEYLRRLGVSEGGSLKLPFLGKVTARGAEGFALDIATDPLTVVAKAVREMPYLSKLLNAPGAASQAVGEAVYKSALPQKAQAAAGAIIEGIPEAGVAGAPIGGTAKLAQKVTDMSNVMGNLRQGLYDKASELGAHANILEEPLSRTDAVLAKLRRNPNLAPLADDLEKFVQNFRNVGKVPLDVLSEWKTSLYNSLPDSAWQGGVKLKNTAQQFKAALALDFKDLIVSTGNKAEKGLGETIDKLNDKWGTLLDVTKPMNKAAGVAEGGGKMGKMIDGAVLAAGGLKAAAIKKSYDLATTPFTKTLVSNALMAAGKNGLMTGAVNRAIIEASRAKAGQAPSSIAAPAAPSAPGTEAPTEEQQ